MKKKKRMTAKQVMRNQPALKRARSKPPAAGSKALMKPPYD